MYLSDDTERQHIEELAGLLPEKIFLLIRDQDLKKLEEIRIRIGQPMELIFADGQKLVDTVIKTEQGIQLLERICGYSVAAKEGELAQGYISAGGYRIGVCGTAIAHGNEVKRYSNITGFNIRIGRELIGCADGLMDELYDRNGRVYSTLLIAAPGVGKTTLLRDITRQISTGYKNFAGKKICLADERSEISGGWDKGWKFDLGPRTDVTSGIPKSLAMAAMIRSMSPEVIICDEVGICTDTEALIRAKTSGVAVIASAHGTGENMNIGCANISETERKLCFDKTVLLERIANKFKFNVIKEFET